MDDVLDDTSDVTVSLGEVKSSQTGGLLSVVGVGLEDTTRLPLVSDDSLWKCKDKAIQARVRMSRLMEKKDYT